MEIRDPVSALKVEGQFFLNMILYEFIFINYCFLTIVGEPNADSVELRGSSPKKTLRDLKVFSF